MRSSGKILSVAVSVILIAYVAYNLFNLVYEPVKTEQAVKVTADDCITITGIALRSEAVIDTVADGIVDYLVDDGDKVAKGEVIANIYASAEGADVEAELRETESEIKRLEAALRSSSVSIDAYALENSLRSDLAAFSGACAAGSMKNVHALQESVLTDFSLRQVIQGDVTNFNSRIEELKNKYNVLESQRVKDYSSLKADDAGFFVSYTDSLETAADYQTIAELAPAQIAGLCSFEPVISDERIGKLIDEYKWYYVAPVSAADAEKLRQGQTVSVRFISAISYGVDFTVVKIESDSDGNTAVILSCDSINNELACIRNTPATVSVGSYTGLRVSAKAIRIVDGVQGVYIARGQKVAFRKISPIYTGDGYVVVRIDETDASSLQQYDDIIIGGKDLYAGKLI